MAGQLTVVRFNIASAATTSNEQDMRAYKLLALYVPTMTSTAITLKGRPTALQGEVAQVVNDEAGAQVSLTVAQNTYVVLSETTLSRVCAVAYLSLVGGTTETGARQIIGVCEPRGV